MKVENAILSRGMRKEQRSDGLDHERDVMWELKMSDEPEIESFS